MVNKDELKEYGKQLQQGVKAVLNSEKYRSYLEALNKFPLHTAKNHDMLLEQIKKQNQYASRVASAETWEKQFHRKIRPGEKGIEITGYYTHTEEGKQEKASREDSSDTPLLVYDIVQTEGEPFPQIMDTVLEGKVDGFQTLMKAIDRVSPYPIVYKQMVPPEYVQYETSRHGEARPYPARIAVQSGMSERRTVSTVLHELAHVMLHIPEYGSLRVEDYTKREKREVQAESVSFIVSKHYGIDTSQWSFPYIATWCSSPEMLELKDSEDIIQKCAGDFIDRIDAQLVEMQKEDRSSIVMNAQQAQVETRENVSEPSQRVCIEDRIREAQAQAEEKQHSSPSPICRSQADKTAEMER